MSIDTPVGFSPSDPTPGVRLQLNLGAGGGSSGSAPYTAIIRGNMLATGSATATTVYGPNTSVSMSTEGDVIGLFGSGSELHRCWRRFTAVNQTTPLYLQPIAEGGGAAAATLPITIAGTATAAGTLVLHVGGSQIQVGFNVGDGYAAIASNAATAVSGQSNWAITSSASGSGVLTLTAKQKGPRGNFLRAWAQVVPSANTGITVNVGTPAVFSGGATQDSNAAALAVTSSKRYYYQVSCANDATQVDALQAEIDSQALPDVGLRQRFFWGSTDTISNAISSATGVNDARGELQWLPNSDWTPAEIAANNAAVYALLEADPTNPECNFSGFGQQASQAGLWLVPAPEDGSAPTQPQITSALQAGVTPIGVNANGSTYLVKRITSHSLSGANPDYSVRDSHRVTVSDFYCDELQSELLSEIAGMKAADDPAGNASLVVGTVTPRELKATVNQLSREYANGRALFENVGAIVGGTLVQRNSQNANRFDIFVPIQIIDIADQVGAVVNQIS